MIVRASIAAGVLALVAGGFAAIPQASPAAAAAGRNWVAAWSAAPQGPSTVSNSGVETLSGLTYATLAQKTVAPPATFSNQTVRQVMHLHYGGTALRVQLSNEFGTGPATFPSVTVGKRQGNGADIADGSLKKVTFDGKPHVTIPQGQSVLSDPVDLPVGAFDDVVLSLFVPAGSGAATVHGNAQQTFYTATGDKTGKTKGAGFTPRGVAETPYTATLTTAVYYATGIQVSADSDARTLVALGDSITDGFFSSGDKNQRYPDDLARRLQANPSTQHLSVIGEGISGSRVTHDGIGPSISKRLDREVFDQPNVAGVIYLQGINDAGAPAGQLPLVTPDEIINGYREVAARMHEHHIPIFIGTLTPAGDLAKPAPWGIYSTPQANATRNAVNKWIRTEGRTVFDGVIDFDEVLKDPLLPEHIQLQYDSGDSLHPNDAGYQKMADAIPLELLAGLSH